MIDFETEHPDLKDAIIRELEIYYEITQELRVKYAEKQHSVIIDQNFKVGDRYRIAVLQDLTKVPDINARPQPPRQVESYLEGTILNIGKGFSIKVANAYFAEKTNPTLIIGEITRVQLGDGGFS
jgi:hypothetical protein